MKGKDYKPYVPADKVMPEFTVTSVILGAILAIVFGSANAYLGLRVGLSISASIPAAVISMGVIRIILKKESILENNMVQTIGSSGESLCAGCMFVIPALFMWAKEGVCDAPSILQIGLIAICGGLLGVAFMVPLRDSLIVEEHETLTYPEGTACAEVLLAGEEGGAKSSTVFKGLGIAAVYKFIADGMKIFPSEVDFSFSRYKGAGAGVDVLPALAGVGYICGIKVCSYMFCGAIMAWLVIMPLIATFGSDLVLYPATVTIAELVETSGAWGLWSNYVRYIGAGVVMTGGMISLIKTMPMIVRSLKASLKEFGENKGSMVRTQQNLSMKTIGIIIAAIAVAMCVIPIIPVNLFSAVVIIIFGFIFSAVSARIVGLVGGNNNPASGMTIATLLVTCALFRLTGNTGVNGMIGAAVIGGIVCCAIAISGDTSQDLKTGFLVGATPKKQQIGEIIGVLVAAFAIGGVLVLLDTSWGFGSAEIPAPQATLMKMVIEGVLGGNLPWNLIFIGVFIAILVEILGIPVLPFGIGLYLPIHLSVGIMCGGLVRVFVEKKKYASEKEHKDAVELGVLYTSGLVAGEGLIGIALALLAIIKVNGTSLGSIVDLSGVFSLGNGGAIIMYLLILVSIYIVSVGRKKKKEK